MLNWNRVGGSQTYHGLVGAHHWGLFQTLHSDLKQISNRRRSLLPCCTTELPCVSFGWQIRKLLHVNKSTGDKMSTLVTGAWRGQGLNQLEVLLFSKSCISHHCFGCEIGSQGFHVRFSSGKKTAFPQIHVQLNGVGEHVQSAWLNFCICQPTELKKLTETSVWQTKPT